MEAHDESLFSFATQSPVRYLWGLAADVAVGFYTLVAGSTAIAAVLTRRSGRSLDVIARRWGQLIVWTCGIRVDVAGLEHVKPGRSYIIVSNHLSNFDIFCSVAALPMDVHFVAKKELARIPIFGQALAISDHIVIDRDNPEAAIATINAAVARSRAGVCILFFAEGTRSPDGKVQPFKKGGVTLALRTQLPILPLSVSGTRKFLPKGCIVIRPGGRVRLAFGSPIETKGLSVDERDALNAKVRQVVIKNYVEDY